LAKITAIAADKAIKTQKRGAKFKLKSKQPPQAKRAKKRKTNERSRRWIQTKSPKTALAFATRFLFF
jgi:hypothetical protein